MLSLLLDVLVFVIPALLGLQFIRYLIKRYVPAARNVHLDAIYVIFVAIGAFLLWPKATGDQALRDSQRKTQAELETTKDELRHARLDLSKTEERLKSTEDQLKSSYGEQERTKQLLAKAEQNLSDTQNELETIKERAAPRKLTDEQKKKLTAFLTSVSKGKFIVKANVTAPDSRNYADEIATLFVTSGWRVQVDNAIVTGPDISGLWITVGNAKTPPAVAGVLQNAFKAAGMTVRGQFDPTMPNRDEVWLTVGVK